MKANTSLLSAAVIIVTCFYVGQTEAESFTLSDEALMSLDWYWQGSDRGTVLDRRDVAGPGVEFDLYFRNDQWPGNGIDCTSSAEHGQGLLAGIDVSMYDTFDLKFTLLSVDGSSSPGAGGVLSVGAVINRTDSASDDMYAPNVVRLAEGYDPYFQETFYRTNISSTTYWTDVIYVVGFCAYQAEYYRYGGWNPSGNNLTLLVEPAPGAVQIVPEPTTLLLLGLGGLTVLRKQRPQPH